MYPILYEMLSDISFRVFGVTNSGRREGATLAYSCRIDILMFQFIALHILILLAFRTTLKALVTQH